MTISPTQHFRSCRSASWTSATSRRWSGRVSFTGELGYEIWVDRSTSARCMRCCSRRANRLGLTQFGMRALLCLRLEKSFGTWFREYRPIYGPYEAGLGRFVDAKRGDFIGARGGGGGEGERRQAAALHLRRRGGRRRRYRRRADLARRQSRRLGDLGRLWPHASANRWRWATSKRTHADAIEGFEIEIIGERRRARRLPAPAYDPQGLRMRS